MYKAVSRSIKLQVPNVAIELKEKAETQAKAQGFSSLQDAVRMFLHNFAEGELVFGVKKIDEEQISEKAMERIEMYLNETLEAYKQGKAKVAKSPTDLINQLS